MRGSALNLSQAACLLPQQLKGSADIRMDSVTGERMLTCFICPLKKIDFYHKMGLSWDLMEEKS